MSATVIVVPCYNEATRLPAEAFVGFARGRANVRFLFVDDGSTDGTWDLLRDLNRRDPGRLLIHRLDRNSGKAEAVRRGTCEAFALGGDYVGFWDADLATPLDEIPRFVDVLDRRRDVSAVIGTRLSLLGRSIVRRPVRRVLGRVFARVASAALGVAIVDTQCGAKLFRRTPTIEAAFAEPFGVRWIFDVELFARLAGSCDLTRAIYELPLERWHDVPGSRLKRSDFVRAIGELWKIRRRYASRQTAANPPAASAPTPAPARRAA